MPDPETTERLRRVLLAQLDRLGNEQRDAAQNASTVSLDQTSVGRLSRMDAMQQQAMAQAAVQRLATHRRRVQAALDRVDRSVYGLCCDCNMEIGLDRLLSDPAAPFCRDCQEERDAAR